LLTEVTNLHDITVRFQRLTGRLPADTLAPVTVPVGFLPADKQLALDRAFMKSPVINSAIENLRASQAELKTADAAYLPKFDLRLRKQLDNNTEGIIGRYDEEAIEVVMTYNLYNGGSDSALKRQYYQQMNSARELRQKACRDVRQQLLIALNDISSLKEQLGYLLLNKNAIANARIAYRKQFDIGQRTLLDLLDTEDEYFEVQRAYRNAAQDLMLAQVRTLSGMGILLDALGLSGRDAQALEYIDTQRSADADVGGRCPDGAPAAMQINKAALLAGVLAEANLNGNKSITVETVDIAGESAERVKMEVSVGFAYKSTSLTSESLPALEDAAMLLRQFPSADAIVAGYTDSVAAQAYNVNLSQKRANAVREALINEYGIDSSRLTAIGYGKENPIADNETPAGRAKNRRVELVMDVNKADAYAQEAVEGVSFESLDIDVEEMPEPDNVSLENVDKVMINEAAEVDETAASMILDTVVVEASSDEMEFEFIDDESVSSEIDEVSMEAILESPSQIEEITFDAVDESTAKLEPEQLSTDQINSNADEEATITFEYLDH
jgi:adhesin transport system outer membrane protein